MHAIHRYLYPALLFTLSGLLSAAETDAEWIRAHYTKYEHRIPMRDGARLFTAVYVPVDRDEAHPILLFRTPYSCSPYGVDRYRESLGPHREFARSGYIFVYQDVRGRFLSEGEFVNMTPHVAEKRSKEDIDESTDTHDTIDWLLENVEGHNGRVGQWGISYPGFYTAAGMIDTHEALVAVSPQAPIADWYFDDFHHHGAFFLPHAFNFLSRFGQPRPEPTTEWAPHFDHGTPDGYRFFLDIGPLAEVHETLLEGQVQFWKDIVEHPDYDEFWQSRNLLPHLHNVRCAVMTVGGWFDAEDLWGPLKIYQAVEKNNPGIANTLVMGPWYHGQWHRGDGEKLGDANFGFKTSEFYQEHMLLPFFKHHLEGAEDSELPEAWVFETGANRWRRFDRWPPREAQPLELWLGHGGSLRMGDAPSAASEPSFDAFISDPARPVPFTEQIAVGMTREYMTADQRFAARRPDVLTYRSEPLSENLTLAGPLMARLLVSTDQSAADWVVKLIDQLPPDAPTHDDAREGVRMGGYQMMVRSEVIRGRYRESYEKPQPFVPGEKARIHLELQDVLHTFKKGHRIVVQIQSSWFPLVDRNPQTYLSNMFDADERHFVRAEHRVWQHGSEGSRIEARRLPAKAP